MIGVVSLYRSIDQIGDTTAGCTSDLNLIPGMERRFVWKVLTAVFYTMLPKKSTSHF